MSIGSVQDKQQQQHHQDLLDQEKQAQKDHDEKIDQDRIHRANEEEKRIEDYRRNVYDKTGREEIDWYHRPETDSDS